MCDFLKTIGARTMQHACYTVLCHNNALKKSPKNFSSSFLNVLVEKSNIWKSNETVGKIGKQNGDENEDDEKSNW